MKFLLFLILPILSFGDNFNEERALIKKLSGCFIVDYNYSEFEKVAPNYKLDPRIYDVEKFHVRELIQAVEESETRIRLQHFMMAETAAGLKVFKMRHHGEVWEYEPNYLYEYQGRFDGNDSWRVSRSKNKGAWRRSITSLDDGLRYQCIGKWNLGKTANKFECSAFSPIPGREFRDMKRADYNTMQRHTKLFVYDNSWLERQSNSKIVFDGSSKQVLANESGKIWSVRDNDSKCNEVKQWAAKRQKTWDILSDSWKEILNGESDFHEVKIVDGSNRYDKVKKVVKKYHKSLNLSSKDDKVVRDEFSKILKLHMK